MNHVRTVTEVARNFAEYINRVVFRGERFVLVRGKRAVAELGPVPGGRRLAELPMLLASLPRLTREEADALERDWSEARAGLPTPTPGDPWAS